MADKWFRNGRIDQEALLAVGQAPQVSFEMPEDASTHGPSRWIKQILSEFPGYGIRSARADGGRVEYRIKYSSPDSLNEPTQID